MSGTLARGAAPAAGGAASIVSVRERPDLVPCVTRWLWEAFWARRGSTLAEVVELVSRSLVPADQPQCLVGLAPDGEPVGTASLVAHDLERRPDLSPWLAGLYVRPDRRREGHATSLVRAIERIANEAGFEELWLYTYTAEPLYGRLGWVAEERFEQGGHACVLMRRTLSGESRPERPLR